jgi:hypothetical protein
MDIAILRLPYEEIREFCTVNMSASNASGLGFPPKVFESCEQHMPICVCFIKIVSSLRTHFPLPSMFRSLSLLICFSCFVLDFSYV